MLSSNRPNSPGRDHVVIPLSQGRKLTPRETDRVLWTADAATARSANGSVGKNTCERKEEGAGWGKGSVRSRCRPVKVYQPKGKLRSKDCFLEESSVWQKWALDHLLDQSLAGGHPKSGMTLAPKLTQTLKKLTAGGCQLTTALTAGWRALSQQGL